jgi:pre-rRNA-processing protein TSR4
MLLLLELHGDLPEHFPDDERRLYIFGCPRKACNRKSGSVRALRATRKLKSQPAPPKKEEKQEQSKPETEEKKADTPKPDLGASLFGATSLTGSVSANQNPFSTSSASSAQASSPFAAPVAAAPQPAKPATPSANALSETFADKVRVSSPPPQTIQPPETAGPTTPWPSESDFPEPYKRYYLDAEYETLSRPPTPKIPDNVTIDAEEEGNGGAVELQDALESQLDKVFMKFSTRLGHNPEQILRYEFRGSPLLYSHTDAVGKLFYDPKNPSFSAKVATTGGGASRIPRCEYCGSQRVFELQLVPHAIAALEDGREGVGLGPKDDGMEWGTIILGVCNKDCGPEQVGVVGWREEWAGVQWEESK